jgi:hypothetical protein
MTFDSSLITKEVIFCSLAALGGMVGLRGLLLELKEEKESEKEWYSDLSDFRNGKHKSMRGAIWVMAGVGIEIIIAVVFVGLDIIDKNEINKQGPLNQPIAYLSATVWLKTAGIDRTATNNLLKMKIDNPKNIDLAFGRRDRIKVPGFPTLFLSDGSPAPGGSNMWWHLQFNQLDSISPNQVELVKDAFKWNVVELEARFLPPKTEVITGYVSLTFNFEKTNFNIRSQMAKPQTEYNPFLDNPPTNVTVFGQ